MPMIHDAIDNIMGFILVCGVIPLCLERWAAFNSWLYGKIRK